MRRQRKKFHWFRALLLLLFVPVFLYAAYMLWDYYRENEASDQIQSSLIQDAVVLLTPTKPTEAPTDPETPDPTQGTAPDTLAPTGDLEIPEKFSELSYEIPLAVDFSVLQEKYPDVVGWLYCEGTPINYPVVQSDDNDYYLRRLPDGSYNSNGSLFMDFRCLSDVTDRNTIIYGHNLNNGTMFTCLRKYRQQSYYEEHQVMWYLTAERAYKLELLAGMVTPSDSETYDSFNSDEELRSHLEKSLKNSTFQTELDLDDVQQIMTLSTCTYEYATARYVVIASLIPVEYIPGSR